MKKRILAILLAIALLSSVAAVVAYAAGEFPCPQCNAKFDSSAELQKHLEDNFKTLECSNSGCNWSYSYYVCKAGATKEANDALTAHLKTHETPIVYTCTEPGCGQVFESAEDLKAHYEQRHTENTNALHCPYCEFIAPNISAYNDHLAANHQKDGHQVTPRDNAERFFDKYVLGIGLNVDTNSFSSVVRVFAYITEVLMSVFTDSGAAGVFTDAGTSGVAYFFETIVPHFWAMFAAN